VGDVVVHGENVFEVRLVGKDVDHPGEHIRVKVSAFGNASLFGIDGAEHAELGMGGLIVVYAVFRCPADVDVPMPAADAEGDALIQLILGSVRIGGVHHTFQHVFQLWSAPVEQSSWFAGIEMEIRLPGIGVADEVVLRLLQFWIRDVVAVEQSLTVVLVALDGCLHCGHYGFCFLQVVGLLGPQGSHIHVAGHGRHAWAHVADVFVIVHVHAGHAGVLGLLRAPVRRSQQSCCEDERQRAGELEREM